MEGVEYIKHNGKLFAIVLRGTAKAASTVFFTPAGVSFQFGVIRHTKGYREQPHTHRRTKRVIRDVEQFLLVTKGSGSVDFFEGAKKVRAVVLKKGDSILLIEGGHALNTLSDFQTVTVKQGPFLGDSFDKEEIIKR